jgi:hypothetical protein
MLGRYQGELGKTKKRRLLSLTFGAAEDTLSFHDSPQNKNDSDRTSVYFYTKEKYSYNSDR